MRDGPQNISVLWQNNHPHRASEIAATLSKAAIIGPQGGDVT